MTIRISKPTVNIREQLSSLKASVNEVDTSTFLSSIGIDNDTSLLFNNFAGDDTLRAIGVNASDEVTLGDSAYPLLIEGTSVTFSSSPIALNGPVTLGNVTVNGSGLFYNTLTISKSSANSLLSTITDSSTHASGIHSSISNQSWLYGINMGGTTDGRWALYDDTSSSEAFSVAKGTLQTTFNSSMTINGDVNIASGNNILVGSGNGIDFSATADAYSYGGSVPTVTSELLDDYERGSWDCQVMTIAGATPTSQTGTGTYVKVGDLVNVWLYNYITTKGGSLGTSPVYIGYLPVQPDSSYLQGGCTITWAQGWDGNTAYSWTGHITGAIPAFEMVQGPNSVGNYVQIGFGALGNDSQMQGYGSYLA